MSAHNIPGSDQNGVLLSPEARALLAELEGKVGARAVSPHNKALADAFFDRLKADSFRDGEKTASIDNPVVVLSPPHNDAKANAFADLLDHLDDEVSTTPKADAVAERFSVERQRPSTVIPETEESEDNVKDPSSTDDVDEAVLEPPVSDESDATVLFEEEVGDSNDPIDDADFDFEIDEQPGGVKGFFARLGGKSGRAVKRLVGVKDASAAYNAQSGALLLPFTIIRAVVLVLVAAVPPIVNLAIIQPQISDNNRKITETLSYQAKATEDEKIANKLEKSVAAVDRRSKALMGNLMPEKGLQDLVNKYVAALQRYGIELNSYNVSSDAARKVINGDLVQDAIIVELDLLTRYDVYAEIRSVFVKEAKFLTVIDETIQAQEGSVDLQVNSRIMVPVSRGYDEELDRIEEGGGK